MTSQVAPTFVKNQSYMYRTRFSSFVTRSVFCASFVFFATASMLHLKAVINFNILVPRQLEIDEGQREIRIEATLLAEGIGAVISNMKPLLYLAAMTKASITTTKDLDSNHGYLIKQYVKFATPLEKNRVFCKTTVDILEVLRNISKECSKFPFGELRKIGIFQSCNTIVLQRFEEIHPRSCIVETIPMIKSFSKLSKSSKYGTKTTDVCVLRRGGDVEERIMKGRGNMWAIDERVTLPILKELRKEGNRLVLSTETRHPDEVLKLYKPTIFSNHDRLDKVVEHMSNCRCMFISSASSFAAYLVSIVDPTYIIHTESSKKFPFHVEPYHYSEFGERAISINSNPDIIRKACSEKKEGSVKGK